MKTVSIVDSLLKNMGNMHELGRERAFELGNPFYAQFEEDGGYYRKEMPDGEKFLVTIEIIFDENEMPIEIKDTIIKRLGTTHYSQFTTHPHGSTPPPSR